MISKVTLEDLKILAKIGNALNLIPWKWNPASGNFILLSKTVNDKRRYLYHTLTLIFSFTIQLICMSFCMIHFKRNEFKLEEFIVWVKITLLHYSSLGIHLQFQCFGEAHVAHLNALLALNQKLMYIYKVDPNSNDGIELYVKMLTQTVLYTFLLGAFPSGIFIVRVIPQFEFLRVENVIGQSIVCVMGAIWLNVAVFMAVYIAVVYLIHLNFLAKWISRITQDRHNATTGEHTVHSVYRNLEFLHYFVIRMSRFSVPAIYAVANVGLVTCIYASINGTPSIPFLRQMVAIIAVVLTAVVRISLLMCSEFTETSRKFRDSFRSNPHELTKWDKCFLRSCRNLTYKFDQFTLSKSTFMVMMNDIVISNVVTLLLM